MQTPTSAYIEVGSQPRDRRLFHRAESAADWIADSLDHHRLLYLFVFSGLYFYGTLSIAQYKYLWADEALTGYLARINLSQIIPALATGTDIHPPLFHLITHLCTKLLGDNALALRMPAVVGGWIMSMSLFVIMSRRSRTVYAAIAMLIPYVTIARTYTYEARGYGISMGFCGLALICWQECTGDRWRRLSCIGLGLSLAAAVSCHYYMVLMVAALGLGEVVRTLDRKRICVATWAALVAGTLPVPFQLALIRPALTFKGEVQPANLNSLLVEYERFLRTALTPALAVLIVLILYRMWSPTDGRSARKAPGIDFSRAELAVAIALALGLVATLIAARVTNGIFFGRYGLCSVFGFSILPVLVLSWYDRMRPVAGAVAFAVLFSLFAGAQLRPRPKRFTVPAMLAKADPAATIIIQSPMRYLELAYNAPVKLSSRLYYLASPADSLHYTSTDNDDRGLLLLQEWAPLRTEAPTNFLMSHRQFLVWCDRGGGWIMRYLADKDARIALLETNGAEYLFKVTISDNAKL